MRYAYLSSTETRMHAMRSGIIQANRPLKCYGVQQRWMNTTVGKEQAAGRAPWSSWFLVVDLGITKRLVWCLQCQWLWGLLPAGATHMKNVCMQDCSRFGWRTFAKLHGMLLPFHYIVAMKQKASCFSDFYHIWCAIGMTSLHSWK